jgi:hypothetical protein
LLWTVQAKSTVFTTTTITLMTTTTTTTNLHGYS